MKNRIALVTGGTGSIGTAICKSLHEQGVKVVATYNRDGNHEDARNWQSKLKTAGYQMEICYVNVTDYNSCQDLIESVESQHGPIDILINNAGTTQDVPCYKMPIEAWDNVINTNLSGAFYMTRSVLNHMLKRNYGRIINISSINGQKGQYGQVNYCASKAGLHGFTKALALEVAKKGITVNTISPGYIATEMVMSVPEQYREQIIAEIPVGRLGHPEEIARTVVFLAADESGFITGSNIAVNGGHYMA